MNPQVITRFAILALGAALLSNSHASPPTRVEIKDDFGLALGTLEESPDRNQLILIFAAGGRKLPVGRCVTETIENKSSPDGKAHATSILKNCGATVDYATQVRLASGGREIPVAIYAGRPRVGLSWTGPRELRITRSAMPADDIYRAEASASGVRIETVELAERARPSEGLELASWTFAKSGIHSALGSNEFLLRLAGWSQQASGLHRAAYGSWTGPAPYGDDPVGARNIVNGFKAATSGEKFTPASARRD